MKGEKHDARHRSWADHRRGPGRSVICVICTFLEEGRTYHGSCLIISVLAAQRPRAAVMASRERPRLIYSLRTGCAVHGSRSGWTLYIRPRIVYIPEYSMLIASRSM